MAERTVLALWARVVAEAVCAGVICGGAGLALLAVGLGGRSGRCQDPAGVALDTAALCGLALVLSGVARLACGLGGAIRSERIATRRATRAVP